MVVEPENQQKLKGKKLTAEMILLGAEYSEEMEVKVYGGASVEIRPLTSKELFKAVSIMRSTGVEDTLDDTPPKDLDGMSETEKVKKFVEMGFDLDSIMEAMEFACDKGIVDDGIRAALKKDRLGAAMEIGSRIMELSSGDDSAILDFIVARTASS